MSVGNNPFRRASVGKMLYLDYDFILSETDDECCFSLSRREVQMLLALIPRIGWHTQWLSEIDTAIDVDNLLKWEGNLARKLMSGCCPDTVILHRVGEGGALEISTDGGTTWIPDPADPRLNGTHLPTTVPGSGSTLKCNAATNILERIKDAQAGFAAHLSEATTIIGLALELAGEVILMLITAGAAAEILVPLMIAAATALLGVLETDYNSLFTDTVWDTLLCDIFCEIGADGDFDTTHYNNLLARIDTDFSGNVALTFTTVITGWGLLGLHNAANTGVATAEDCSSCECVPFCQNADNFIAGTVNSVTDNGDGTVTFNITSADNGGGTQYIAWEDRVNADSPCCVFKAQTAATGSALGSATQACGSGTENLDNLAPDECLHYFHFYKNFALSTPFTCDVTLGGDCP